MGEVLCSPYLNTNKYFTTYCREHLKGREFSIGVCCSNQEASPSWTRLEPFFCQGFISTLCLPGFQTVSARNDGICGLVLKVHPDKNWGAMHIRFSLPHCSGTQQCDDVTNVFSFLPHKPLATCSLPHKCMSSIHAASRCGCSASLGRRRLIRLGRSEMRSHKKCSSLFSVCCSSKPTVGLFAICSCLDWNIGRGTLRALYERRGMKLNICSGIFACW